MKFPKKSFRGPNGQLCLDRGSKQCNISGSALRIFFKFCGIKFDNKKIKITKMKFLKNPLLDQMSNFGMPVAQNQASLYLRICSNDSLKLCCMTGHSKQIKLIQGKFLKNLIFSQGLSTFWKALYSVFHSISQSVSQTNVSPILKQKYFNSLYFLTKFQQEKT